ncbi:MAG TPA: hypothetical protein VGM37_18155 [Armatimonadota bacterium]|jgi:uncharacterized protein YoxC
MQEVTAHFGLGTNIVIALSACANLALFGGLVFMAFRLKSIVSGAVDEALDRVLPKVQPVLDNVSRVTGQVSEIVEKVAPKVEHIAEESEGAVHSVSAKVKTTSNLVTENVARPIVNIASLLTGVQRGIEVWKTAKTHNGNGTDSTNS